MRILIVDDDEVFAQTLARSFKRREIESDIALDLSSALTASRAAATEWKFDAILLDLRLGEESGLSILEELRAAQPDARILILTGYSSIATTVDAIKKGADNYLPKPSGAEEILRALEATPDALIAEIPEQAPSLDRLEWEHIQRVLSSNDGNISASARELGMHRRTLQRKLAKRPVRK